MLITRNKRDSRFSKPFKTLFQMNIQNYFTYRLHSSKALTHFDNYVFLKQILTDLMTAQTKILKFAKFSRFLNCAKSPALF